MEFNGRSGRGGRAARSFDALGPAVRTTKKYGCRKERNLTKGLVVAVIGA